MKKILFAIAIVLTIGLSVNAQSDGFFSNFNNDNYNDRGIGSGNVNIIAPNHGLEGYAEGDGTAVPLGTGLLIMTALGAGYAVAKRRKK